MVRVTYKWCVIALQQNGQCLVISIDIEDAIGQVNSYCTTICVPLLYNGIMLLTIYIINAAL